MSDPTTSSTSEPSGPGAPAPTDTIADTQPPVTTGAEGEVSTASNQGGGQGGQGTDGGGGAGGSDGGGSGSGSRPVLGLDEVQEDGPAPPSTTPPFIPHDLRSFPGSTAHGDIAEERRTVLPPAADPATPTNAFPLAVIR